METTELTQKICKAASDKKAANIITMDMRGVMSSTDYMRRQLHRLKPLLITLKKNLLKRA